ncbi:MAG: enoyl-CoA hydratase/isomerase family protein [Cyclobacteriaceae bacterium]|nr:enoyl-CoA hydratase/isomerase family protein [Cyclobacteriaceae bacterium]
MNSFENLLVSLDDRVMSITINRPASLNALNIETIKELGDIIELAKNNPQVSGIVITGAGDKSFVAGADITEIADLNDVNGRRFAENGQNVFEEIEKCEKPVIAAINGFALGGGCELAMACHIRVAVKSAKFGQPEVNLGLIPGYGGTQRLTQLVGKAKALELMMTGDLISADEALSLGLVNHVVENSKELENKVESIMKKILAKAPLAVGMVITCVNAVFSDENGYQVEANGFAHCCQTEDKTEGTKAFLEKRKPEFAGH